MWHCRVFCCCCKISPFSSKSRKKQPAADSRVFCFFFFRKAGAVNAFAQILRRYTSLNHLAQAARAVLTNSNQITQMLADINKVDFANVQVGRWWTTSENRFRFFGNQSVSVAFVKFRDVIHFAHPYDLCFFLSNAVYVHVFVSA